MDSNNTSISLADELAAEAVRLRREQNLTIRAIARRLHCGGRKVSKALKEAGLEVTPLITNSPPRRLAGAELQDAIERYTLWHGSLSYIASLYHVSRDSLRQQLVDAGVQIRPRSGRGTAKSLRQGANGRQHCRRCDILLEEAGYGRTPGLCRYCQEELDRAELSLSSHEVSTPSKDHVEEEMVPAKEKEGGNAV